MYFLWQIELHPDYSHFPAICPCDKPEFAGIEPNRFTRLADQAKGLELWRRGQKREITLSVYLSHFSGFDAHPNPLPADFFDARTNILFRRHQGFLEHRSETEPVVLLSPGLLLDPHFDFEPALRTAEETGQLVIVTPCGKSDLPLSGLWIIPPAVQTEFCRPIPAAIAGKYRGGDIGYWLAAASRLGKPVYLESEFLENLLPEYAEGTAEPALADLSLNPPLTVSPYPAWTEEEFLAWMDSQRYRLASTMRWCPHEYIIIDRVYRENTKYWDSRPFEDQLNYLMATDYIYRHSHIDQWYSRFQIAAVIRNRKYWNCGSIDLLNATDEDLKRRIFKEDGKDEFGKPIKTN